MENFIGLDLQPSVVFPYKQITNDSLFSHIPTSKMKLESNIDFKNNYKYINKNEINDLGYRSDNFIKNHNKKHIVFTGCSYTFGDGLLFNETWSKRLYDKIQLDTECSGYFNLGIPGSSLFTQISDLFKYFNNFSNPDIIFLNITDLNRMFVYNKTLDRIFDGMYSEESSNVLKILAYQYYYMLNQYCISNNIKLYSFSWSFTKHKNLIWNKSNNDNFNVIKNNFNNFYIYNIKDMAEYVLDYKKNNPSDKYSEVSRDLVHLGNAYNSFWADFMYKIYRDQNV